VSGLTVPSIAVEGAVTYLSAHWGFGDSLPGGGEQAPTGFPAYRAAARQETDLAMSMSKGLTTLTAALFGAGLLVAPVTASAEDASGFFAKVTGTWNGNGTITMQDGAKERIRCRIEYKGAGKKLDQLMRCASDSYKFNVNAAIEYAASDISGKWNATDYDLNGEVTGRVEGNQMLVRIRGSGLSVNLVVAVNGKKQDIKLISEGTKVSGMTVSLAKGS
jgi:hypothetical protein